MRRTAEVSGQKLVIAIEYSLHDHQLDLGVFDDEGKPSMLLDGYKLWGNHSQQPLGEIQKGRLKVDYQWTDTSAIQIVSPDGEPLAGSLSVVE